MDYSLKVIQVIGPSRDLDCRMQFAADAETVRPMQQTPTKSRTLRGEGSPQGRQPAADAEVVRPRWRATANSQTLELNRDMAVTGLVCLTHYCAGALSRSQWSVSRLPRAWLKEGSTSRAAWKSRRARLALPNRQRAMPRLF